MGKDVTLPVFQHLRIFGRFHDHDVVYLLQPGIRDRIQSFFLRPAEISLYNQFTITVKMVSTQIHVVKNPFLPNSLVLSIQLDIRPYANNRIVIFRDPGTITR